MTVCVLIGHPSTSKHRPKICRWPQTSVCGLPVDLTCIHSDCGGRYRVAHWSISGASYVGIESSIFQPIKFRDTGALWMVTRHATPREKVRETARESEKVKFGSCLEALLLLLLSRHRLPPRAAAAGRWPGLQQPSFVLSSHFFHHRCWRGYLNSVSCHACPGRVQRQRRRKKQPQLRRLGLRVPG